MTSTNRQTMSLMRRQPGKCCMAQLQLHQGYYAEVRVCLSRSRFFLFFKWYTLFSIGLLLSPAGSFIKVAIYSLSPSVNRSLFLILFFNLSLVSNHVFSYQIVPEAHLSLQQLNFSNLISLKTLIWNFRLTIKRLPIVKTCMLCC